MRLKPTSHPERVRTTIPETVEELLNWQENARAIHSPAILCSLWMR